MCKHLYPSGIIGFLDFHFFKIFQHICLATRQVVNVIATLMSGTSKQVVQSLISLTLG